MAAGLPWWMPFPAVGLLAAGFVPFMVVSRRRGWFPAVHAAERSTLGEVYFPLGVLAAAVGAPHRVPFAFGVLVLGIGDAAAAVVGGRFGRRGYRVPGAAKTWVGSATLFAVTFALAVPTAVHLGVAGAAAVAAAAGIAAAVAVAEGCLGGGTDNLVLPLLAAGLASLLRT